MRHADHSTRAGCLGADQGHAHHRRSAAALDLARADMHLVYHVRRLVLMRARFLRADIDGVVFPAQ
jgi:hypothetical protein